MAGWGSTLFIFLLSVTAFAAENCGYRADLFALKSLSELPNHTCEEAKASKECQDLYAKIKANGEEPSDKALQCKDQGKVMRALENQIDYRVGCALGGWSFVKDSFLSLGTLIGESAAKLVLSIEKEKEQNAICDKDLAKKRALYTDYNANVPKLLRVEMPKDEIFGRVPCAQLKVGLQLAQRRQSFVAMDKVRTRFFDASAKFNPEEQEYVSWIKKMNAERGPGLDLIALAKDKIKDMGVELECYNTLQASAMVCEAIANVATLATGPAGAALKAVKANNILKIAGVAGKTEKAAVDLERAAKLSSAERTEEAAKVVNRELKSVKNGQIDQKDAVLKAHEVGDGRGYRTKGGVDGEYTFGDLKAKAKTLKEAEFTSAERRALMESGVVGQSPATRVGRADQMFIPKMNEAMTQGNSTLLEAANSEGAKYYKARARAPVAEFKKSFPEDRGVTEIIEANYFGLGTEDSAQLVNKYLEVHNYNPEQGKLAIISSLRKSNKFYQNPNSKIDSIAADYRVYRNKELEQKLTMEYYAARYPDRYKELDYDRLSPGQLRSLQKLSDDLKKLRAQAQRNKWPNANEYLNSY